MGSGSTWAHAFIASNQELHTRQSSKLLPGLDPEAPFPSPLTPAWKCSLAFSSAGNTTRQQCFLRGGFLTAKSRRYSICVPSYRETHL